MIKIIMKWHMLYSRYHVYSIYLLFTGALIGCAHRYDTSTVPQGDTLAKWHKDEADTSLKKFVQANYRGWTLADTAAYHQVWWSFHDRRNTPYLLQLDIDDDQVLDYICLLTKRDSLAIAFLFGKQGGSWEKGKMRLFSWKNPNGYSIGFGILPQPPGKVDVAYPKDRSLVLLSNAVCLNYFESPKSIYYWNGSDIVSFELGE